MVWTYVPGRLAENYAAVAQMRATLARMRQNQAMRGVEQYKVRMAARHTNDSWRNYKGLKFWLHEANHPGNKPFVIGFACSSVLMYYMYFQGLNSEKAKAESHYYQRFFAKDVEEAHKLKALHAQLQADTAAARKSGGH